MKNYADLGHVYRGEPCKEYPGAWLAYSDGKESSHTSFDEALRTIKAHYEETGGKGSVCWACSDNDPRVGQVWFTGFYQHGKLDTFGRYVS